MFKKKYKQFNNSPRKSKLDQVLWFIENYLPQKKDRGVQKKLYMDNLEAETIKIFSKLASTRSKTLLPTTKNTSNIIPSDNSNLKSILSNIFPNKKIVIQDNNDGSQTIFLS